MVLLIGSFTIGLILALLALGVLISFRVLSFRDLTVYGSITLGGAVTAALIVQGVHPVVATAAAFAAGMAAGCVTGVLHTRGNINGLLAGILVMTALYSVNLHVMGKSNVPVAAESAIFRTVRSWVGEQSRIQLFGWEAHAQEVLVLAFMLAVIAALGAVVHAFFRTNLGLAMRATGDNPQMIRALGVDVGWMITLGLALSNGLVALSGGILVQYQGFADVQMGIGMVVWGFASVIIGETLVGTTQLGLLITGAVMGSILFRLLVAIALRWGLNPNDLKLVTAAFVLAALVLPDIVKGLKKRWKTA
jgi:putative tryptophan/tyrosine transport system permease protein